LAPTDYSQRGRCCHLYIGPAVVTCLEIRWRRASGFSGQAPSRYSQPRAGRSATEGERGRGLSTLVATPIAEYLRAPCSRRSSRSTCRIPHYVVDRVAAWRNSQPLGPDCHHRKHMGAVTALRRALDQPEAIPATKEGKQEKSRVPATRRQLGLRHNGLQIEIYYVSRPPPQASNRSGRILLLAIAKPPGRPYLYYFGYDLAQLVR
jgi:hypothetical protein